MRNSEDLPDCFASKQAAGEAFGAALAPVEEAARDALTGPGRVECESAHERDPQAFEICVRRVLSRRNVRSPLALLVKIVREDHAMISRTLHDPAAVRDPVVGADEWMRMTGFRFQREDARAVLEDEFRAAGDVLEALMELYDQLQGERAFARAKVERSLREVA